MQVLYCDELDCGFGWIAPEPRFMERASHALLAAEGVWLIDPVDGEGVEDKVGGLGRPGGVIRLLDRHGRDCAALAARLGVPLYDVPFDRMPGAPFQVIPVVRSRLWREVALWWPERRILICGDALGTASYFRAPGEQLGVHPFLRLLPPRALAELEPGHVLCGHGEGVHGPDTAPALREALRTARRRIPAWLVRRVRPG